MSIQLRLQKDYGHECSHDDQHSSEHLVYTRIAANYLYNSELQVQMYTGADWYITFGFVPFIIELDTEAKLPRIRVESPIGAYPEFDRYGRCVAFAKRYAMPLAELISQFPEHADVLLGRDGYDQDMNSRFEILNYVSG